MYLTELFQELFNASTEIEVTKVLNEKASQDNVVWHPYGDSESFFGVIENQQASAIPALVEKITNSIDAIMMKKCIGCQSSCLRIIIVIGYHVN